VDLSRINSAGSTMVGSVYRNKMCHLCELINNNLDGIVLLGGVWQPNNEIHAYIFLFLGWYRQGLNCTGYFQVASFYSSARLTL
jgi:hypothetical protein